jgi:hypothetical protein
MNGIKTLSIIGLAVLNLASVKAEARIAYNDLTKYLAQFEETMQEPKEKLGIVIPPSFKTLQTFPVINGGNMLRVIEFREMTPYQKGLYLLTKGETESKQMAELLNHPQFKNNEELLNKLKRLQVKHAIKYQMKTEEVWEKFKNQIPEKDHDWPRHLRKQQINQGLLPEYWP